MYVDLANQLITWLQSKTAVLGLIRDELVHRNMRPMSVIRPVPTQWTAYYLAYSRLLVLKLSIINVFEDDARKPPVERLVIQPAHDRSTREKAQRMVKLANNQFLWTSLERCVINCINHLLNMKY